MKKKTPATPKIPLGPVLQRYFCEYLVSQRDLSPQTIGSYRDTLQAVARRSWNAGIASSPIGCAWTTLMRHEC